MFTIFGPPSLLRTSSVIPTTRIIMHILFDRTISAVRAAIKLPIVDARKASIKLKAILECVAT